MNSLETILSTDEYKKEVISFFESISNITISNGKKIILAKMKKDRYDNDIVANNVRLWYCENINYAGGESKGYGKGWYISHKKITGIIDTKI